MVLTIGRINSWTSGCKETRDSKYLFSYWTRELFKSLSSAPTSSLSFPADLHSLSTFSSFFTIHQPLSRAFHAMASVAKTASRAFLRSTPATSSFRPAARSARFALPLQGVRTSARRGYASEAGESKSSSGLIWGLGFAAAAGVGAYFYLNGESTPKGPFVPTQADYQKVYDAIADRLANETDYDDGSYGPVSGGHRRNASQNPRTKLISSIDRFWFVSPGMPVVPTIRPLVPAVATALPCVSLRSQTTVLMRV